MSILSVDTIQPIGSGTSVTVNSAATLVLNNANSTGVITATTFVGALTGTASGNPTLANGSDNRVITATGANALTGESNLTFDGTNLSIGGNVPEITLTDANSSGTPVCKFSAAGGNINIQADTGSEKADTYIAFSNDGGEKLRITSAGLVGIATNSPSAAWVDIATSSGSYDHIRLRRLSSDSNIASNWSLKPYGGNLYFRTGGSTDKIYFDDSGDLNIMDGNLTIATAGHGIDYSAQTAASSGSVVSEIMNHFSTGTIGVTLKAGSNTVPLYNNTMRYTRIGNICFVSIWIRVNGSTVGSSYSSSDTLKITGFPFAPTGNNDGRTRMRFNGYSFSGVSNKTWGWLVIGDGAITTEFELHWGHPDFSTITAPNGTNIHNSSSEIYINGHYFV